MSVIHSFTTFFCKAEGCSDKIGLERTTGHAFGLEGGHVTHALVLAAQYLGWGGLRAAADVRCPKHNANLEAP